MAGRWWRLDGVDGDDSGDGDGDDGDDGDWSVTLGADPQALRRLGSELSTVAREVEDSLRRIEASLKQAWWSGPTAEQFRQEWRAVHARSLRDIRMLLHDSARNLASQAFEQERASDPEPGIGSGHGAGAGPGSGSDPGAGPEAGIGSDIWAKAGSGSAQARQRASELPSRLAMAFASNRKQIRHRLDLLRQAEAAELADRSKWYRLKGLLSSGDRLEVIRRAIEHYEGLGGSDRQILLLGQGRVAEVFGDLASAERIGIWVPGVGTDMGAFANPEALAANRIWGGEQDLAMIEWLGYDPPATIPLAAMELGYGARSAGTDLNRFVSQLKDALRRSGGDPSIVIGGHSYGSVVAAYAASIGTEANGIVLAGSPGVPVRTVAGFRFDGVSGTADSVAVVGNRFDPVSLGHLGDEAVGAVASVILAPLPLGATHHLVGGAQWQVDPATWWSEMSEDPATEQFGALRLPSNETHLLGAITGSNHRYSEPGSTSLNSLRSAFRR